MSFELIRMRPHPNRQSDEEVMVVIKKGSKRVKEADANLTLFRLQLYLLDTVKKKADGFQAVGFSSSPKFDVVANHANRSVEFSLGEMGQLMPLEIRGGGLGSIIMSDLVKWAKSNVPDYSVDPLKVFAAPDEGDEALLRNKTFLGKMGFVLSDKGGGSRVGLYGVAATVGALKVHTNAKKVERVELPGYLNEQASARASMGNQVEAESSNARMYKEELQREKETSKGKLSFWAGLLLGLAGGAAGALLLSL